MKFPKLADADPYDATLSRYLKFWISGKKPLASGERERLLQSAAVLRNRSALIWRLWLLVPSLVRWLIDNVLIGSADQPMVHSLSAEYAFAATSDLTILLAKRGVLQSLPLQMGVICLLY